jgi:hypothetical protein
MVDGAVVKYDHRLLGNELSRARLAIAETVAYAQAQLGAQAWNEAMQPEKAEVELRENPYTYTEQARALAAQRQEHTDSSSTQA